MKEDDVSPMEDFIRELLDDGEIQVDPSPDGIGMKASIGHLFSEENGDGEVDRIFIQLYVLSTLPKVPNDPELGYTEEEVEYQKCVILADVASRTNPPEYCGEVVPIQDFKKEYIQTPALDIRLDRFFDQLQQHVIPRESWLAQATSMYHDRLPGKDTFIKQKKIC